jgi:glycosyl transferase family 87
VRSSAFWVRLGSAALVPIALAALWWQGLLIAIQAVRPWSEAIDYKLYRAASLIGFQHGWQHIYDAGLQRPAILPYWPRLGWPAWWHSQQPFWTPMVTPPPAAWLVAPLNLLDAGVAAVVWQALLVAALAATVLLIAPPEPASRLRYLVLPLLTWATGLAILSGNLVVLMGLAIVVAWRLLEADRPVAAGVVLGLGSLKPLVMIGAPLLLLVAGQWRVLVAWAGTGVVLAGASLATLGAHGLGAYRDLLAFVSTFGGEKALGIGQVPGGVAVQAAVAVVTIVAVATVARAQRARGPAVLIALGLLGSLLLTWYANLEDYVLLLPAAMLLLRARRNAIEGLLAVALGLSASFAAQGFLLPTAVIAVVTLAVIGAGGSRRQPLPATVAAAEPA